MNEKLQEALAEIINLTLQGKDFVLEQAPDVIGQLLAWNLTISLIWFVLGCILGLAAILLITIPLKLGLDQRRWELKDTLIVAGLTLAIISPLLIAHNLDWIKILIAPKVYLLEYASQLIG